MTVETGSNHLTQTDRNFEWTEIISRLPSGYQELPESCRDNVARLITKYNSLLVGEFPRYPVTPYCLAQVSGQLERRTSLFARELASWGYKRVYGRYRSFKDIWFKAHELLEEEIKGTERKELVAALGESISQDTQKRLTGDKLSPPLLAHCLEATKSFADPSFAWAMVSDRPVFGDNFPLLSLPIYSLGASGFDFGYYREKEVLTARFLYLEGEETKPILLTVPLKE